MHMTEELEKLKQEIDKYDTISFDVFDTLLLRNLLSPTDLFYLLDNFVKETYGLDNFHDIRILMEKESREKNLNNETTLDKIYQKIEQEYHIDATEIKNKEIELEKKFLVVNPFMMEIYKYARQQKKKVLAISDMYLPKKIIKDILKINGYVLDEIYVSSENFLVKGNGILFESVLKKEKLNKDTWLHIGDNKISDVESPESLNIHAYHYKRVGERSCFVNKTGKVEESILKGIIQNMLFTHDYSYWEKFGITCVAPIYYGFTNWIYQMTKHKDNIYFLARDGYIIKPIYELFLNKLNKKIDTYYLYCSRASYQIPSLVNGAKEDAVDILTRYNALQNQHLTIENILNSIGLDKGKYRKEFQNFELSYDTVLDNTNIYRVKKFLSYIYDDIKEKLTEKKLLVEKYLKQMNLTNYSNVNIVDIGWAGSTQFSISQILPKQNITGYYFGTRKSMYENVKYNSFGFMFDSEEPMEFYKMIDDDVMMYEFIFSAPHGSTLGFKEENKKVVPVLEDFNLNNEAIEAFQSSAVEACKKFLVYYDELKQVDKTIILSNYEERIKNKDFEDLKMFSNITESISYDGEKMNFVKTFTLEEIENDLKGFYQSISSSLWKNTFFVQNVNENEYLEIKNKLFGKKARMKALLKSISFKSFLRAFRYPRTTIRKIKVFFRDMNGKGV